MMSDQETQDLMNMLQKMDMRTRRIEAVLIGDEQFKVKGLVDKVSDHHTKIKEFELDKTKIVAGATVLGTVAGFLSAFLHKFID